MTRVNVKGSIMSVSYVAFRLFRRIVLERFFRLVYLSMGRVRSTLLIMMV